MKNVRADARCTSSWRWCRSAAGRRGGRRRRRRSCSRCLEPSNHRYSQCCSRRVCTALTLKLRRVAQLCGVARLASSRRGAARWRRLARLQARARSPPSSGRWGGCTPVLQKARGRCAPSLPLTQPTASPLASLPPLLWRLFSLPRLPSARTSQPSPLTTLLSPLSLTIHLSLAAVCRRRHHRCNRHRAVTTSPAAVCHRHPCRPTSSVASLPPSPPPPHHHHPCHRRCLVRRRRRCRPRLHRLTPHGHHPRCRFLARRVSSCRLHHHHHPFRAAVSHHSLAYLRLYRALARHRMLTSAASATRQPYTNLTSTSPPRVK